MQLLSRLLNQPLSLHAGPIPADAYSFSVMHVLSSYTQMKPHRGTCGLSTQSSPPSVCPCCTLACCKHYSNHHSVHSCCTASTTNFASTPNTSLDRHACQQEPGATGSAGPRTANVSASTAAAVAAATAPSSRGPRPGRGRGAQSTPNNNAGRAAYSFLAHDTLSAASAAGSNLLSNLQ